MGVDVVGGIPHFERTMADGAASVRLLCEIAAERGLLVDMHCDETDDPLSRHIETLACETQRLGLQGRVTGSHLTSMHSMDNYYVSQAAAADRRGAASASVANPLINITLQGRHDTYPKRRGMTRVPELMAAGVDVAFGHDCVMDPWYAHGQRRHAGGRAHGPARGADDEPGRRCAQCFDAVTVNAGADPAASRATASRRAATPTSCCCRRAIRSRRSGCARPGCRSGGAASCIAESPAAVAALQPRRPAADRAPSWRARPDPA